MAHSSCPLGEEEKAPFPPALSVPLPSFASVSSLSLYPKVPIPVPAEEEGGHQQPSLPLSQPYELFSDLLGLPCLINKGCSLGCTGPAARWLHLLILWLSG